jgi:hypothetical protein
MDCDFNRPFFGYNEKIRIPVGYSPKRRRRTRPLLRWGLWCCRRRSERACAREGPGRARRRAAALGSLWSEFATNVVVAALRRTIPRQCDSTALQRHRWMQALRTTWAACFIKGLRPRCCAGRCRGCATLQCCSRAGACSRSVQLGPHI